MQRGEQLYTVTLITALLLNGIAIAGASPMRVLLAPLRERRLLLAALFVDVIVLPVSVIGTAILLGLDEGTRAGLIIIMAASTGPIGMALVRILRAEVPVAVSIVAAFSASNIVTVPFMMWLLIPEALHVPAAAVIRTLLLLVIIPLLLGWTFRAVSRRLGISRERLATIIAWVASASTVALASALAIASLIDLRGLLDFLASRAALTIPAGMVASYLVIRLMSADARRRVALWVALNARAAGLSLTIVALHLADAPNVRAAVIGYAGATQLLPLLLCLATRRRWLPATTALPANVSD
jgi:BASS family bile acid:Na+ symporter